MGDLMLSTGALGSPLTKLNGFLGGLAEVLNDSELASSALKASLADMLLPINSLLGFNLGGFFNTAEAGWKDLTNWQDLTTKSLGNMVQKQEEEIAATAAQMRTTDKSSDAYKALQTQLMSQKARLGELKDVLGKKTTADEANAKAVKAEEEAEKKRAAQLKDTTKEAQKAREEAEKHRRAMEDLVAEHTVLGEAQLDYSRSLAEVTSWYKKGEISASEYDAATLSLGVTYAKARGEAMGWYQSLVKVEEKTKSNEQQAREFREALQYLYELWGGVTVPTFDTIGHDLKQTVKIAAADGFAEGITDGLLGTLMGDDFADAWSGIWQNLWQVSATRMDGIFKDLFSGSSWQQTLENAGLTFTDDEGNTRVNKWSAASVGVWLIMGYGVQKQNRWVSAAGGALSGAATGAMMGSGSGPWGAIIGAIVGAVAGYIMGGAGSGGRKDYSVNFGGYGVPSVGMEDVSGPERAELARQFFDKYKAYRSSFGDVLRTLGQDASWGGFQFQTSGSSRDLNSMWKQIISGELPRAMLASINPQLIAGLQGIGVSDTRIGTELQGLQEGSFDTAFLKFHEWISAIVDITDLEGLLGKSPQELRDEVNQGLREGFLGGIEDTIEKAGELTSGLNDLFSDEQVSNAQELYSVGMEQYRATLQYFAQLEQLSQGIADSVANQFLSWEETRAEEQGSAALSTFYQDQLAEYGGLLGGAGGPEQIERYMGLINRFSASWWDASADAIKDANDQLNDMWREVQRETDPAERARLEAEYEAARLRTQDLIAQWEAERLAAEEQLREAERIAQEKIVAWEEEASAKQEELRAELERMRDALTGAGLSLGDMSESLTDSNDGLDQLTDTTNNASEQLATFTERLAAASENLDGASISADALATIINRIGGSILITVALDDNLAAQQQSGQTDLVRIIRRGQTW